MTLNGKNGAQLTVYNVTFFASESIGAYRWKLDILWKFVSGLGCDNKVFS